MIRVIVADDHEVVRRGLTNILEAEADILVVAEASDGQAALDRAMEPGWDVLLLDISMPKLSGLAVIEELRRHKPGAATLVLSVHPEEPYAVQALRAGALGYLNKECAARDLVTAVRAVSAGHRYISTNLAETLAGRLGGDDPRPLHEKLSARELRVLCLLASGQSTSEIATALFLSPKTVATYRGRLMQKMGMATIAEITRYAVRNELID